MKRKFRSIFSKITLVFSATLFASFAFILLFGSLYINHKALTAVESDCVLALKSIEQYIVSKHDIAKQAISTLYNTSQFDDIPAYMASDSESFMDTADYVDTVNSYFLLYSSLDNDITCIALENQKDQKIYAKYRNVLKLTDLAEELGTTIQTNLDNIPRYGFCFLPTTSNAFSSQNGYNFTMICNVKRIGMQDTVGHLLIDFSIRPLRTYTQSLPYAQFYILSENGTILYDQDNEYTGQVFSDFHPEEFQNTIREQEAENRFFVSTYNQDLNLYFVSTMPLNQVYRSTAQQKMILYLAIFLLVLVSLAVTLVFSKQYHRRINQVCDAIHRIEAGDLETQIPTLKQQDELSLISDNLNHMCTMLRDYIQKVYVTQIESQSNAVLRKDAELKQKVAELYALQTQIDPHFMFNTLETIRMRALSSGSRDVAQMIYLLATLFRQNLKEGFVTTLNDELRSCRLYLDLMLSCHPNNVQVEIDAPEEFGNCGILRHILQPVIENSIKHGLRATNHSASIHISIRRQDQDMCIAVIDNGKGISAQDLAILRQRLASQTTPKSSRIGLSNVHQRLVSVFGQPYGLTIESEQNIRTTVTIRVPFMPAKEIEEFVQRFDRR